MAELPDSASEHGSRGAVAVQYVRRVPAQVHCLRLSSQTRRRDIYSRITVHEKMPADSASAEARRKAAREVIDILHEIATLLVRCQHLLPPNVLIKMTEHSPRPSTTLLLRLAHRKRREP
jgi:hypothetical protein